MAEIPFGGNVPAPNQPVQGGNAVQTLGTITNWAGAVVSLALVVGVGIWGYQMISRDVSGVPVVRAASKAPMRVAPDDPGGRPALHQGLAVNEVAADGAAARPADRLILAPAPVSLEDEDLPQRAAQAITPAETDKTDKTGRSGALETPQMESIRALADQLSSGAAPLAGADSGPETVQPTAAAAPEQPEAEVAAAIAEAVKAAAAKPEIKGGLKRSLRPVLRPDALKKAAAVAVPEAASARPEVDPAGIPAGTKLAQLGAFDSPETARGEWDKLNVRFADYLDGKQMVIQKAQSGGRIFYRLRAMGFADLSDARRFCSALVAEKADCIPVSAK
ncbi:SPOR domain-containing protein [Marimonas arenosa]|uniref:SPOR domain-containing protein n=1 Tax=Marimonas arenosa TaxID=1795305 RepID=A0AAE4B4T2_9RHOB|nr:SPOR domain-containing protein [Marimonas arenosa]MDQ2088431.1 SPOR domain-containing protein [Marimonas arenosa]